jgi:hypothetical protein
MPESRCIQGDLASSPSADSGDIAADHYTLHLRLDRLAAPRQTAASASAKPQQNRQRLSRHHIRTAPQREIHRGPHTNY